MHKNLHNLPITHSISNNNPLKSPPSTQISLSIIPKLAADPPQLKMMTSQRNLMIQPEYSTIVAMPRYIHTTTTHRHTSRLLAQKYKNHATQ